MEIKVSIIMPSLNVAAYIEEAVQSVMDQTLQEIEIICIDAGSEDGTWEILCRLAKIDRRIVLHHSGQKSYGYQVNLGIATARGKYIAIVETDDYVDPKMYENLYREAVLHDCDYVKSDYFAYWTQDDGKRFFVKKKGFLNSKLYGIVMEPKLHWETFTDDWYLWSGIYKKDFLSNHHIYLSETPGAAFQDIGFLYQTNIKAKRALYLKNQYYHYCMDRVGASSNSGKGLRYAYQEFCNLFERIEKDNCVDSESTEALYCRMSKSFMCCYGEMESGGIRIADGDRKKYYRWFKEKIENAKKQGIINKERIHSVILDKVEALLISEECYIEKVQEHEKRIKISIGEPKEFQVVIFGCGYYGYNAYRWLKKQGYTILAFIDNDQSLWKNTIDGFLVSSPQQIVGIAECAKYLIANEQHSGEMKRQLLDLGVEEEDICIYV